MADLTSILLPLLRNLGALRFDAETIATLTSVLLVLTTITQALKKGAELLADAPWVERLPFVGSYLSRLFGAAAHGEGPVVINAVITFATMGVAMLQDNTISGSEAYEIIAAVLSVILGANYMYKLQRAFVWTRKSNAMTLELSLSDLHQKVSDTHNVATSPIIYTGSITPENFAATSSPVPGTITAHRNTSPISADTGAASRP